MSKGKYAKWLTEEGQKELGDLAAVHTDEELIAAMGVASSTFYNWLKKYPEIAAAIEKGRSSALAEEAVEAVEDSLYERCIGGTHTVMKGFKVREVKYDAAGKRISETEHVELVAEQVYVPADVNAIKFFLTNRKPERWKNRTELSADDETREGVEAFLQRVSEGGREF